MEENTSLLSLIYLQFQNGSNDTNSVNSCMIASSAKADSSVVENPSASVSNNYGE